MKQDNAVLQTPDDLEDEFFNLITQIQDDLSKATQLVGRLSDLPSVGQIRGDLTIVLFRMHKVKETLLGWNQKGGVV